MQREDVLIDVIAESTSPLLVDGESGRVMSRTLDFFFFSTRKIFTFLRKGQMALQLLLTNLQIYVYIKAVVKRLTEPKPTV